MDEALKSILAKIARQRGAASLTDAELAYVARIAGLPGDGTADAPAPLWRLVRKNALLFKGIFEWHLDSELDAILLDAGASSDLLKGYYAHARYAAVVSKDALKRSVRRHLTHEQVSVRAHAARLVGLLELDDTVAVLVDSLESGREERRDWGHPVIAASLEALAMMRHPRTRAFAMKYVTHDDWSLRRAAQAAALVAEGRPSKEELRRILETQFDWTLVGALPDVFVDAAKEGILTEETLDRLLESLTRYITSWETVADIVVAARWKDAFARLMNGDDWNMRAALATRAAWSKETWTAAPMRARLDDEDAPEARMALVTALGTLDGGDDALVRARLDSDDPNDKLGAIWATLGTRKWRDELEALVRDPHPQVRRAAWAALAANDPSAHDAAHVELAWTDLLNNEDSWWTWKLPLVALQAVGVRPPAAADVFRYVSGDIGRFDARALERAVDLCRKHPLQLLRWMRSDVPPSQRVRAIAFAGLAGEAFDGALEHTLLEAEPLEVAQSAALEVLAGTGPRTQAADLKARIAIYEQPKATDDALAASAVFASYGDSQLRKRATSMLASFGAAAEPYLAMLLAVQDAEVARAAADAVAQLSERRDDLLADVARLLHGDARKLSELSTLDRLVMSMSPRVRCAVAELGATADVPRDQLMSLYAWLVVDRDADVAAAALGALAAQAGDATWVKALVLAQTWSPNWRARERAVAAMGQIADPMFLSRLLELAEEEDVTMKESAVRGLERMGETHPELGLLVVDIREPTRVLTRYGLNERIDWQADKHTEGLRMLLLGLDKRKDAREAKKHAGRKVMISEAAGDSAEHGHATWSPELVDQLAMYLRVVYTDDESGAIVAEVAEEPTGEVLSAILQSTDVAVRRVFWS